MANTKEIRTKIASIKSTQKITKAMQLVAASKVRRAQERMEKPRHYARKIHQVITHVAASHSEYHHPFMQARDEVKRVGYIVVSSDRGLCGGLNVNLFRALVTQMQQWHDKSVEIDVTLVGKKAEAFFSRHGGNIVGAVQELGDEPDIQRLIGVVKIMLDAFSAGKIDRLYLVSNEFVNTMTQEPTIRQLLPLKPESNSTQGYWDYIYEPDEASVLLDHLLVRYMESQVYQSVVENAACEQAARMVAMQNATENAGSLIDELQLIYNKARQASITQEISEIVAGAEAIS